MMEDNQACISDVENPVLSNLLKQIDLKYQFLADHMQEADVQLHYVSSKDIMASTLTKNLPAQKFGELMILTWM